MFKKRSERLTRLSEEIAKRRGDIAEVEPSSEKPRRVDNSALFARIHQMRQKGGAGNVPLC